MMKMMMTTMMMTKIVLGKRRQKILKLVCMVVICLSVCVVYHYSVVQLVSLKVQ